jgi:voltage-gated potassium channel
MSTWRRTGGPGLLLPFYRLLTIPATERMMVAAASLCLLTIIGVVGYEAIEGMRFLDAFYMTVITLSTVGYSEVQPLSDAGKIFSAALIMLGLGTVLYSLGAIAEFLLEGRLGGMLWRRAMMKNIATLEDHVIVCGYGRLGRVVAEQLVSGGVEVVVIESNPELEAALLESRLRHIIGSALDDDVLRSAGIERAKAIAVTTPDDAETVFITMSARALSPSIAIHARSETDSGSRRLGMVGADQIISPYHLSGQRMAHAIVRPTVVDFIELSAPGTGAEIDLEQVVIGNDSELEGCPVDTLRERGLEISVVALRRGNEPLRLGVGPGDTLSAGDRVVVVGERAQLRRLAAMANPASS